MHKSQVSIELWERFIDHVGIESDMDPIAYYPAIRTCCLVCTLWLPRSRYNLYRIVFITGGLSRSGQAQVLCLARTVCERRDIACLINELRIRPRTLGRTVPLVVVAGSAGPGGWASSMISLRCLKLVGISWYPGLYFTAISRLPALAHLELRRVAFNSASHLFHLIWSLPHLVSLDLHQVTIRKVSQMKFGESCWTCPKAVLGRLTELSISGNLADTEYFPPLRGLGQTLRKVYLEFSSRHWHTTRLREMLLASSTLEELHAVIRLGGGATPPDRVCSNLLSVLSTRSTIRLVKLDLRPASFMRGGYGVTRSRMTDAFIALDPPPSVGELLKIELSLFDETAIHDSVWWSTALSSRQSQCWSDLIVEVQRSYVQSLWLREDPPRVDRVLPKKALLIGIQYIDEIGGSSRSVADVKRFWELLVSRFNYHPEDIAVALTDDNFDDSLSPTKENILNEIRHLVSGVQEGSSLVLFYSGRALKCNDTASSNIFEGLIPLDYAEGNDKTISKAQLGTCLALPIGVKLSAIIDSCQFACMTLGTSPGGILLDLDHYYLADKVWFPWVNGSKLRKTDYTCNGHRYPG